MLFARDHVACIPETKTELPLQQRFMRFLILALFNFCRLSIKSVSWHSDGVWTSAIWFAALNSPDDPFCLD